MMEINSNSITAFSTLFGDLFLVWDQPFLLIFLTPPLFFHKGLGSDKKYLDYIQKFYKILINCQAVCLIIINLVLV